MRADSSCFYRGKPNDLVDVSESKAKVISVSRFQLIDSHDRDTVIVVEVLWYVSLLDTPNWYTGAIT